jgi:hypothetical protein
MHLLLIATMIQHFGIIAASILEHTGENWHAVEGTFVVNAASQRDDC